MSGYKSFKELDCYRKCREVRIWIHRYLMDKDIRDRDIIQNITRAGRSTTRNIAEGFGRHHHKENIQFCRISRGSLHEILDDFQIIIDEKLSTKELIEPGEILTYQALKSVNGYIKYLKTLK